MIIAMVIPVIGDCPGEAFGAHLVQAGEVARCSQHVQYYTPLNQKPHDTMRNGIMQEALDNGADVLYFVDDDTLVPKGAFPEMLRVLQENKAVVVSGHYYRRGFPFTCVWSKELDLGDGPSFHQVDALAGLHEIHTTGLGCALIDLEWVRAHLSRPWFEMLKDKKTGDTIIADDTTFLTKVRNQGGLILGHAGIRCVHLGGRPAICDETVEFWRKQASRSLNPELENAEKALSEQLLIQENLDGNYRKQHGPQRGTGDASEADAGVGAAKEPAIST